MNSLSNTDTRSQMFQVPNGGAGVICQCVHIFVVCIRNRSGYVITKPVLAEAEAPVVKLVGR
jgi:hypothetical protein